MPVIGNPAKIGSITPWIINWFKTDVIVNNGPDYPIKQVTVWGTGTIGTGANIQVWASCNNGSTWQYIGDSSSVFTTNGANLSFTDTSGYQLMLSCSARWTTQSIPEMTYLGCKYGDYTWQ